MHLLHIRQKVLRKFVGLQKNNTEGAFAISKLKLCRLFGQRFLTFRYPCVFIIGLQTSHYSPDFEMRHAIFRASHWLTQYSQF